MDDPTDESTEGQETPDASLVLVLGILGFVIPVLAPVAWVKGTRVLREIDAGDRPATNRDAARAGRLGGQVATLLWAAVVVVALVAVVVVLAGRTDSAIGAISARA